MRLLGAGLQSLTYNSIIINKTKKQNEKISYFTNPGCIYYIQWLQCGNRLFMVHDEWYLHDMVVFLG